MSLIPSLPNEARLLMEALAKFLNGDTECVVQKSGTSSRQTIRFQRSSVRPRS